MLSKNGEVKVVDFGLAKAVSQLENTDEGVVKGKFSYLSPEAALGEEVDARTDVFALGIITWEMLANRRLFVADDPYATVQMVREARIPSLPAITPNVVARARRDRSQGARAATATTAIPTAAEYGDALADFMFANELKATSRDLAAAVRAVKIDRERTANPKESLIHALVMDERARMMSIIEDELVAKPARADAGRRARRYDRLDEEPARRLGAAATWHTSLTPRSSHRIRYEGSSCGASSEILRLSLAWLVGIFLGHADHPYGRTHKNPRVIKEPGWDSPRTRELAKRACFDCHSNETRWPWYANVAPFSWVVQHDVENAREVLNFSRGRSSSRSRRVGRSVGTGNMPPVKYRMAHPEAQLTPDELTQLAAGLDATLK